MSKNDRAELMVMKCFGRSSKYLSLTKCELLCCFESTNTSLPGPPGNKKCSFFVDDISMPVINSWGDQITNEIVRQCLDEKGCYSLDRPGEWKTFAGVNCNRWSSSSINL